MGADNRSAIVAAVIARMEAITVANGYLTDAGKSVTRWRSLPPAAAECPTIDVRDSVRRLLGTYTQNIRDYELTVDCSVCMASGPTTDSDLNDAVEDIVKAMMDGDLSLGGTAMNMRYEADEKAIEQRDVKIGVVVTRFQIHYRKS